jgi:glycosyltransferase involved in cell wall biosynthesis
VGVVRYSFVIPVFNERDTLRELHVRLSAVMDPLDGDCEVLFVDDASFDGTDEVLAELVARDPRCKVIRFARNFGHQTAITAGLDFAAGDAVVVLDADLQDPPEVIPELIARWREGYEVVYGVRRSRPSDESWLKRVTARIFYRTLRRLSDIDMTVDVGDFRLVDRRALEAFRSMRERSRYVRGMFSWVGFRQIGVDYERPERFAGEPKYSFRKSLRLAVDGIVSFSDVPLRLALVFGTIFSALAFLAGIFAIVAKIAGAFVVPGWASILVVTSFLGGVQLTVLGAMGLYIGRIYEEVKSRPLYIVREAHGFEDDASVSRSNYVARGA